MNFGYFLGNLRIFGGYTGIPLPPPPPPRPTLPGEYVYWTRRDVSMAYPFNGCATPTHTGRFAVMVWKKQINRYKIQDKLNKNLKGDSL